MSRAHFVEGADGADVERLGESELLPLLLLSSKRPWFFARAASWPREPGRAKPFCCGERGPPSFCWPSGERDSPRDGAKLPFTRGEPLSAGMVGDRKRLNVVTTAGYHGVGSMKAGKNKHGGNKHRCKQDPKAQTQSLPGRQRSAGGPGFGLLVQVCGDQALQQTFFSRLDSAGSAAIGPGRGAEAIWGNLAAGRPGWSDPSEGTAKPQPHLDPGQASGVDYPTDTQPWAPGSPFREGKEAGFAARSRTPQCSEGAIVREAAVIVVRALENR